MRRMTFTFDNGPWSGMTESVLDFLADRGILATFFVVGDRLADPKARRLAERAHSEGHWIGNHTLTHGEPFGRNGGIERVAREIGKTERLMEGLAHPRKFFRPNGTGSIGPHLLSPEAENYLSRNCYTVVTWNNAPGDWIAPHRHWLDAALRRVEELDWSVLVLHDHYIANMMDTLETFHDEIVRQGVEIVQDFPAACIAIDRGRPTGVLEGLVTPAGVET